MANKKPKEIKKWLKEKHEFDRYPNKRFNLDGCQYDFVIPAKEFKQKLEKHYVEIKSKSKRSEE